MRLFWRFNKSEKSHQVPGTESRHPQAPPSLAFSGYESSWDPVFTVAVIVARQASPSFYPDQPLCVWKLPRQENFFFPQAGSIYRCHHESPSAFPRWACRAVLRETLISFAWRASSPGREGAEGDALMGNASAQEKTQWIKEESASKHEFLFSRRRAKPDFIATALRAAAVGFHGRGSAGKSISGAAVWRGSKKGH